MTFSDFAQMMYPFINKKGVTRTTHEYVKYLIGLILEKENTEDEQCTSNPLSEYDDSTLAKYYNGKRNLSTSVAKEILCHLDKNRFEDYLTDLPHDAIILIGNALQENNIELTDFTYDCIVEACSKTFIAILYDCSRKDKSRGKKNSYTDFISGLPRGCNMSRDAFIQLERNRLWWEGINKK